MKLYTSLGNASAFNSLIICVYSYIVYQASGQFRLGKIQPGIHKKFEIFPSIALDQVMNLIFLDTLCPFVFLAILTLNCPLITRDFK